MKTPVMIIRRIVLVIIAAIFLFSAFGKFSGNAAEVAMFSAMHLASFRIGLGVIDIILAFALLWRPTRSIAILIASAYLGGAIAEMFSLGMLPLAPGIILLALWVVKKLSWYECHNCSGKGHCHCPCEGCKDCTGMSAPQQ